MARILLLAPVAPEALGGNATTLRQWREHLEKAGHAVRWISCPSPASHPDSRPLPALTEALVDFRPQALLIYHLWKAGRFLPQAQKLPPFAACLGGTDVNEFSRDQRILDFMMELLGKARCVISPGATMAARCAAWLPNHALDMRVMLPPGSLSKTDWSLRRSLAIAKEDLLFFLPAGIRKVKRPFLAVEPLERLRQEFPSLHLVLAGPVLDPGLKPSLDQLVSQKGWIHHLPKIPLLDMAGAFEDANVVLNTSFSEGLSTALVEAQRLGAAILAADNPGNQELITPEQTGLLFRDLGEFHQQARRLARDPALRTRLGDRAKQIATRRSGHLQQGSDLLRIIENLLSG
jgi:glycosyltransferase involved in cell wall biosynthesis